ncbi:MAG TPA: hypothetical protein VK590_12740 [Saprospiraceae bacterium]|nr:hypothetical protein [Saprospiraceae bacterium]
MNNQYHMITRWILPFTDEEVYRTLEKVENLAQWWPSVYLDVVIREKGIPGGVGKVVELFTKGWLPYTLIWKFKVTEANFPSGFSIEAIGDFNGKGVWTFKNTDAGCEVVYDWKITAEKPILRYLSFLMKPIFIANHNWAMRQGYKSLLLELKRLKGEKNLPKPPSPTFPHNLLNNKVF